MTALLLSCVLPFSARDYNRSLARFKTASAGASGLDRSGQSAYSPAAMKSYWYVGGCCVFATILAFVKAEEPGPRRVLILANEDTVVGNVIEDDGRYRVQEGSGETIYPFARVLKVCDTL